LLAFFALFRVPLGTFLVAMFFISCDGEPLLLHVMTDSQAVRFKQSPVIGGEDEQDVQTCDPVVY
jgi:hypothetical protein